MGAAILKRLKQLIKWGLLLGLAGVVAIGAVTATVYYSGKARIVRPEDAQEAQAIMVLGALVFPDGGVSQMVGDRLETALGLYQAGKATKILVTGDHGQVEYDEVNTMRRWLEQRGVPPEHIFMDHAGFDTYDSMYRARDVFQARKLIVVTQEFHLPRALYIGDRLGLEVQGVVADRHQYYGAQYYEFREMAARVKAFGEVLVGRRPVFLGPVIPISGDGRATHDDPK